MNINKQNIEELLFDYFEGQLTPTQGDALMGFIHQHPEYEKDFMQWKKAYHYKDHKIKDYGIASSIKKPLVQMSGFKPYYLVPLFGLGFALGFMSTWVAGRFNNEQIVVSDKINTPKLANKTTTQGVHTMQVLRNNKTNKPQKAFTIAKENPKVDQELVAMEQSVEVQNKTVEIEKVESPIEVIDLTKHQAVIDSSKVVAEAELPNTEVQKSVQEKKKTKKRRSGIYSTTDKLLPINQNF